MNKGNIVKNQHYIPESLLEHFTNPSGKFFEVLLGVPKVYVSQPDNSMCEMYTYEHENLEVNTIENFLSNIDGEVAAQMKEVLVLMYKIKRDEVELREVKKKIDGMLHQLLVFYYRSGALLTEFSSLEKEDKIPLLTKKILDVEYILELANTIKKFYNFAILETQNDFLMSDQYISTAATKIKARFFDISNRHIGLTDTMILIPISSSLYAIYWQSTNTIFKADAINTLNETQILSINQVIINNSYVKSICPKVERIEQVLNDFKIAFPSQIFAGGNPRGYVTGAIKKKEVFYDPIDTSAFDMLELAGFVQYKDLGRNDKCGCGSDKKFKKCHEDAFGRIKFVLASLGDNTIDYRIPGVRFIEEPVGSWSGYKKQQE